MDRCRCEEYAAAIKKLRFYTVGTYMPSNIDKYDRSKFDVAWVSNGVSGEDLRFEKPKAWLIGKRIELPEETARVEHMWCPWMSPIVPKLPRAE